MCCSCVVLLFDKCMYLRAVTDFCAVTKPEFYVQVGFGEDLTLRAENLFKEVTSKK